MVKTINLSLDEQEYRLALETKGKRTWKEVLLDGLQHEREDIWGLEHQKGFVVKRVTMKPIKATKLIGPAKATKLIGKARSAPKPRQRKRGSR